MYRYPFALVSIAITNFINQARGDISCRERLYSYLVQGYSDVDRSFEPSLQKNDLMMATNPFDLLYGKAFNFNFLAQLTVSNHFILIGSVWTRYQTVLNSTYILLYSRSISFLPVNKLVWTILTWDFLLNLLISWFNQSINYCYNKIVWKKFKMNKDKDFLSVSVDRAYYNGTEPGNR